MTRKKDVNVQYGGGGNLWLCVGLWDFFSKVCVLVMVGFLICFPCEFGLVVVWGVLLFILFVVLFLFIES